MGYVAPQIPQVQAPQFDFGDTLIAARKAEAAKNQQRAELLLGQQRLAAEVDQNKAQNSFADRRTKIEEGRAKDEGDTHKAEVTQQVLQALDAGRPDLAHQIAKRYPGLLSSATTQAPAPQPAGTGDTLVPPSVETPGTGPSPVLSNGLASSSKIQSNIQPTEPGNIDLTKRPQHKNPDGSVSTVRSMSFSEGGPEILVPTIADDGTPLSEDQAIKLYHDTGRHLGKFETVAEANAYARRLHEQQAGTPVEDSTFTRAPDAQAPPPKTTYSVNGDSYDPTEALRATAASRQRNVETTKTAFGETGNPKYVNLAASLAASGVPPEKIAPIVSAEMEKDNARTAKDEDTKANRTFLQQEHVLNREQSDDNNRRMTAAIIEAAKIGGASRVAAQGGDLKPDAGAARDVNTVEAMLRSLDRATGINDIRKTNDAAMAGMAQIAAGNPVSDQDAIQLNGKLARLGQNITEPEMHAINEHLAPLTDRPEQIIEAWRTGRLSTEQRKNLGLAMAASARDLSQKKDEAYQAYAELGKDPTLKYLAPHLNAAVKARFRRLGRDVPDVVTVDENAPPGDVLGAGRAARREAPPASANPIAGGHAASKAKNAGRAAMVKDPAVQAAIAQLKAAPNDPRAPAVRAKLQEMGIDVQ